LAAPLWKTPKKRESELWLETRPIWSNSGSTGSPPQPGHLRELAGARDQPGDKPQRLFHRRQRIGAGRPMRQRRREDAPQLEPGAKKPTKPPAPPVPLKRCSVVEIWIVLLPALN
jgi:hypothetical protein